MKCKLCGKKGVRLSHWRNEHPDYMARKRREASARRKKQAPTRLVRPVYRVGTSAERPKRGSRKGRRGGTVTDVRVTVPVASECPPGFVVESITYRRL